MNRKASLSIIFVTVFIDLMGFGILIPILPTFAAKDLGISDFGIGSIVAVYSLVQFLFNPLFGRLSDSIGRRPVIIISLFTTFISYLLFAVADSFLILFLSRVLAGFGGSNIAVAQAYVADVTPKQDRSKGMGMIGAAFGLGFVFGPMIGGLLSHFSYSVAGYGSAAFSLLAFLFAIFLLPESLKEKKATGKFKFQLFDLKYIKKTITHPKIGILILLIFIIVFSMANIYGTFAILGYKVYHFTDQQTGYLFGIIGLVQAFIQGGLLRYVADRFRNKSLVVIGTTCMIFGLGLIPYGGNFLGVGIVVSILAVGTGLLQPTLISMISNVAPEEEQGTILGLNQSLSSLARVMGPLWGGFAYDFIGYQFPFLTGALFTFITLLITLFYIKKDSY